MKRASRKTTRSSPAALARQPGSTPDEWFRRSGDLLLSVAIALIVAGPLITSEGAVWQGTHVVWIMGWLLLTPAWLVRCLWGSSRSWHIGPTGGLLLLFLLVHSISAVMMLPTGHARLSLNSLWLWISFGMLFLAVRQLVRSGVEQRAACGVLLALGVGLAALGLYQVGYSNPKLRAEYAENSDEMLRREGVYSPPGSPERVQFENRLASVEPIATFALTNSLAGFLAPCLVLLVGLAPSIRRAATRGRLAVVGTLLLILVVAGCLILTKSRAAYVAVVVGLCLLPLAKITVLSARHWRKLCATAVGLTLLAGLLTVLGGLDREVLTEAPKSLLYRLQYWRASAAMIADHPWLGCGPGNFKEYYTQYKLAEASETVADPHNFLFEIAATAGLPALLVFASIGVAAWWPLRRRATTTRDETERRSADVAAKGDVCVTQAGSNADAGAFRPVYAGAALGFLLAFPVGWVGGMAPRWDLLWVTLPVTGVALWLIHPWVIRGTLRRGPLMVAAATLLTNLLAAGGIGFPGVAEVLWVLLALALNGAELSDVQPDQQGARSVVSNRAIIVGLATAALLLLLGHVTMYRPVLAARERYAQGLEASNVRAALEKLHAAALADPWWADPCVMLAELCFQQWMAAPSQERLARFDRAVEEALRRDRRASLLYRRCGDWLIKMYSASQRQDLLQRAIEAHQQAVRLYPNSNVLHAQLAWDFWLAGDPTEARRAADEALRLDSLLPHEELKLKHQKLAGGEAVGQGGEAEQRMRDIRRVVEPGKAEVLKR